MENSSSNSVQFSGSRHQRRNCGHCNESLSYSAYRSHRALYYIESEERWIPEDRTAACVQSDLLIADVEEPASKVVSESFEEDTDSTIETEASTDLMPSVQDENGDESSSSGEDYNEEDILILDESDDENCGSLNRPAQLSPLQMIVTFIIAFLLKFRVVYNISDHAIVLLLRFFKHILHMIGIAFQLQNTTCNFPQSIHGCYTTLNLNATPYKEYVVCPSCHLLYDSKPGSLVTGISTQQESTKCSFVEFPEHPQRRFRERCNTALLFRAKRAGINELTFKPRRVYYYYGLKQALTILLNRRGFLKSCNQWHQRHDVRNDMLADITDGNIWKQLVSTLTPVHTQPTNFLGLLINVDWFQPYKHVSYSVGVIYAVLINLPRNIRYHPENVIIVGIIPGPHEPKKHINTYLGPFVNELLLLCKGIWIETVSGRQFIQCVVAGISSDIPATRKAAGFVGHNASKACSRCLKNFPRVNDRMDCTGFDKDLWPPRTHAVHCSQAYKGLTAKTKAAREEIEREYGARYSVLFELPYYDAIRFPVIDVMHNLFLGTAKNIMSIWKDQQLLTKADFRTIQERIKNMNVPGDIGRIPYKIESGLASLTADQWKTWTCLYSLYVLSDLLPNEHLDCWWLFVQACIIICQPLLTNPAIDKADKFLQEFCQSVENLYGSEACTINLHLHCHLAECLRDYGPVHATWCFSFERYNGILGGVPNNNRTLNIEKTMMNRFVQQMESHKSYPQLNEELEIFFPCNSVGSVSDTLVGPDMYLKHHHLSTTVNVQALFSSESDDDFVSHIGNMSQHALESCEVLCLEEMYRTIFSACKALNVSRICYQFSRATIGRKLLSSQLARKDRSSYVCANWLHCSSSNVRPGRIRFFFRHYVSIETENNETLSFYTLLAYIDWYQFHPEKRYYNPPVTIWSPDFEPPSAASFMPIKRIVCRCVQTQTHIDFSARPFNSGQAIIIIPIDGFDAEF